MNENGSNPLLGGDRDPHDFWDFFDTPEPVLQPANTTGTRSHTVTIGDVIGVVYYIGTTASSPAQTNANGVMYGSQLNADGLVDGEEYDRTMPDSTKPYRSGPPNGGVTIGDAIVALAQVGANCSAPPS